MRFYYRLTLGDRTTGLGWTRRFAAAGYVRWYGRTRRIREGRSRARYVGEILSTTPAGGSIHLVPTTRESWSPWPRLDAGAVTA
jgi:hypothetical protein